MSTTFIIIVQSKIGYLVGPAGSGKSHMTASLYEWMNNTELDVITLNLDPGVQRLPYSPDIDVRRYVTLDEVVDQFDLGPNGGIIAAMDQIAIRFEEILEEVKEFGSEYMLVDLPGQMEVFAFRNSGPLIISELSHNNQSAGLFLIDPTLTGNASSFVSILLFGLSITYRLNTGMTYMISKADILSEEQEQRVINWSADLSNLHTDLYEERSVLNAELSRRIVEVLMDQGMYGEFPLVSSETNKNVDVAIGMLERIWASHDVSN